MKRITQSIAVAFSAAALLLNVSILSAQEANPAPAVAPGAPSQGNVSPQTAPGQDAQGGANRMEQIRQRMNETIKTSLKVSDEEWAVIQPLLEKAQEKLFASRFSGFGAFGGRRGGGDRGGRPALAASAEADVLKAALESDSTPPAEIKAKLEAVRAARKKALAELEQAREDLRKVLTQRQEAALVMMGILE